MASSYLEQEYEVEKIVDRQFNEDLNQYVYLVKWKGYPSEQNTWEAKVSLAKAKCLVRQFFIDHGLSDSDQDFDNSSGQEDYNDGCIQNRIQIDEKRCGQQNEKDEDYLPTQDTTQRKPGRQRKDSKQQQQQQQQQQYGSLKKIEPAPIKKNIKKESSKDSQSTASKEKEKARYLIKRFYKDKQQIWMFEFCQHIENGTIMTSKTLEESLDYVGCKTLVKFLLSKLHKESSDDIS